MLREIYVRPVGLTPAAQGDRAETVLGGLRLAGGWLDFMGVEVIERNGAALEGIKELHAPSYEAVMALAARLKGELYSGA